MAMSYKRAWSLVEDLRRAFGANLIEATPGERRAAAPD
jgi:molybdenum-dependent DNA-binding transcriptional regulator ModE